MKSRELRNLLEDCMQIRPSTQRMDETIHICKDIIQYIRKDHLVSLSVAYCPGLYWPDHDSIYSEKMVEKIKELRASRPEKVFAQ